MATGIYQTPITCGFCETTTDVDFFCLTCKGNLCTQCKNSHTRVPVFRNHKVVPILDGLQQKETEEECKTHLSSLCSMHCDDCKKLICSKCVSSGEHKGHNISEIEAAIQKVQQEIKEYNETLETKYLSQCENKIAKIKQDIEEFKKVTISVKSKINDRRTEIITEINKTCDDMINKTEDESKHQILDMDNAIKKLEDRAKEIEPLIIKGKEALTKLASEQIKFNREKPSLPYLDVPETPSLRFPTFNPGTFDKVQISVQIGEFQIPQSHQSSSIPDACDVSIIQRNKFAVNICHQCCR